jgi:bifunctional non-homologous end joining protein LigD
MLAVPGALPTGPDWSFELKWDGVRAVCYAGPEISLLSRNDRDITAGYPEVGPIAAQLPAGGAVLDGELVAFDAAGRPSFGALQQRMHVTDPGAVRALAGRVPVVYLIFDLLRLSGHSLLERPYRDRRELLDQLELTGDGWNTPPAFDDGADLLAASRARGLEGVVAKRRDSRYEPGRRSAAWRKIKHVRTQEVVLGGWRPGEGRRAGRIGSVLMGLPDGDRLRYVGQVGTGFSDAMLDELGRTFATLSATSSPFHHCARAAHWLQPRLVAEVAFAEWTADGLLRQPSWRGLRPDKSPDHVIGE